MEETARGIEFLAGKDGWRDRHRIRMLMRREIPGVLPVLAEEADRLRYDVRGVISLTDWCRTRELGERELTWILNGLFARIREGEDFLLGPGCFVLSPERIFLKLREEEVFLCVRPEGEGDWTAEILELGRFLLEAIDYKEEESVKMAYEFYHIGKKDGLIPEDFRDMLESRVYTVITDREERRAPKPSAGTFPPQNTTEDTAVGGPGAAALRGKREAGERWIRIEASHPEKELPEIRRKTGKEEKKKKVFRSVLTLFAAIVLAFILYQSGF